MNSAGLSSICHGTNGLNGSALRAILRTFDAGLAPGVGDVPVPVVVGAHALTRSPPSRQGRRLDPPTPESLRTWWDSPGAPAVEAPILVEEAPAESDADPAGGVTLRLATERGSQSTFQVTKSGATIGRGPESTIQLADLSVSRKHARIAYRQGAYWLSDLGSMGGTWVDGAKLAAPRRGAAGQAVG